MRWKWYGENTHHKLNKIDSFHAYSIDIAGHELPIGRNYKQDVQKKLKAERLQM